MDTHSPSQAWPQERDLVQQLESIHDIVRARYPTVDRVAFALYDQDTELLKTFVSSNSDDVALRGHEAPLREVPSLLELARSGGHRVVDDIPGTFRTGSLHTEWLKARGYLSSYTTPIFDGQALAGFLFYDSKQAAAFTAEVCGFLDDFSRIIAKLYLLQRQVVEGIIATVHVAVGLAGMRDIETREHLHRMAHYSKLIARHLMVSHDLSDEFVEYMLLFAPLHDIGKVGVPDSILLKPGSLSPQEWDVMKNHVRIGMDIIDQICDEMSLADSLSSRMMRNIVGQHHERCDGTGYPRGLHGDEISLEARIVAVADMFDALCTHRPYKPAWPMDRVTAELRSEAALGRLDAECVDALLSNLDELLDIQQRFADPSQLNS